MATKTRLTIYPKRIIKTLYNCRGWQFPFTIGDTVTMANNGGCYSGYTKAFQYFFGREYSDFKEMSEHLHKLELKVIRFVIHGQYGSIILVHLRDRFGRNVVCDPNELKLCRKIGDSSSELTPT